MEFSLEKIKQISDDSRAKGVIVKVRDVAYYVLKDAFGDPLTAYRAVIEPTADAVEVTKYENGMVAKFVAEWAGQYVDVDYEELAQELTFEENKAALVKMLADINRLEKNGDIDHKDAIKMAADIRVKLNDKFAVQDDNKSQIVMVPPKYNKICPHTQRECYEQTKEYAMAQFHLIPDPSYNEEES